MPAFQQKSLKAQQLFLPLCLSCYKLMAKILIEIREGKLYLVYKCDCINRRTVVFNEYYYGLRLLVNFQHFVLFSKINYAVQCNGKSFQPPNCWGKNQLIVYIVSNCSGHRKRNFMFCMQCQKEICENCVITTHSSHSVKSLREIYKTICDDFNNIVKEPKDFVNHLLEENNLSTNNQLREDLFNLYTLFWESFQYLSPNIFFFEPLRYLIHLKTLTKKRSTIIYKKNFQVKFNFLVNYIPAYESEKGIRYNSFFPKVWLLLDNKINVILFEGIDSNNKPRVAIDFYDFYLYNHIKQLNPGFFVETMIKLDNNKVFLGGDGQQIWDFSKYKRIGQILFKIKYTTGGIFINNHIIIYGDGFITMLDKEGKTKTDLNSFPVKKTIKLDNKSLAEVDVKIIKIFYQAKNSLIVIYTTHFEVWNIKTKKKIIKKLLDIDNCRGLLIYDSVLSRDGLIICFIYQYNTQNNYLVAWETKNYTLQYKIPKKVEIGNMVLLKNIIQINDENFQPTFHDTQTGEEICECKYDIGVYQKIMRNFPLFRNYYVIMYKYRLASIIYIPECQKN